MNEPNQHTKKSADVFTVVMRSLPPLKAGDVVEAFVPTGIAKYHEYRPAILIERIVDEWHSESDEYWKMKLEDGSIIYLCENALINFRRRQ